ncbi:MAG: hypothetical protein JRE63_05390 [Deltaproteobacteria bacterium]|jgi:hypothetical protein|nr:hypothetical protein [Deltaproteobacteria bacterium]MBW2519481.1 hypothetical protein [Deltaproteobacteria bacterium]
MRTKIFLTGLFLSLLLPVGCSSVSTLINPPEKQQTAALDDFIYALRWQQYKSAAGFMDREHRKAFLGQFSDQKDLTVTDVRLVETLLSPDGQQAEAVIDIDYYLLPSVSLKTFRLEQTWAYSETEGRFRIITPFPPFP